VPAEPLPTLPCATFCADYWSSCSQTLKLFYDEVLGGDYAHSPIINCELGGTFSASWGAIPQPADTWGSRPITNWLPTINGLLGQEIFPNG
jgi:hypothetical protein